MNASNLQHAAFALVFQAIAGLLFGAWIWGGVAASMFFLAREAAQQEYHLTNGASVKSLKPWEAFDFTKWRRDGLGDLLAPVVACAALAAAATALGWPRLL